MDQTPADVLEQAADILLVNGRCAVLGHDNRTGEFCVLGAIAEAINPGWWQEDDSWYWTPANQKHPATVALANRVLPEDFNAPACLPSWNDADETTDDDVRDALLLAAKDLRGAS